MLTPREGRFAKLAVEEGMITPAQLEAMRQYQEGKRAEGATMSLWDSAVLQNTMDVSTAERLRELAGDLEVEKLDEYTLVQQLGRGGMGSVWLALGAGDQKVAVKVLNQSLAAERAFLTRFLREAEMSKMLQNEGIVRGLKAGEAAGHYYFAMEFVDGESVDGRLQRRGPFSAQESALIIQAAADALAYAHECGIVHRDIKPANIMLTREGKVKVADLGVAHLEGAEVTRLTATGVSMGTPYYMAPEQCRDAKRADARSDIYSLGATWFTMVVGKPPFTGDSPLEVMRKHMQEPLRWPAEARGHLPGGVVAVIELMMNKRPEARLQTMRDVVQMIEGKCLRERDIFEELGIEKGKQKAAGGMWAIRVSKEGRAKEYRLPERKLRDLIRSGKLGADVPARRLGGPGDFEPIGTVAALAGELPTVSLSAPAAPQSAVRRRKSPRRNARARKRAASATSLRTMTSTTAATAARRSSSRSPGAC